MSYVKPIEKNGYLTVEFRIGEFAQKMALSSAPAIGAFFHDPSEKEGTSRKKVEWPDGS